MQTVREEDRRKRLVQTSKKEKEISWFNSTKVFALNPSSIF